MQKFRTLLFPALTLCFLLVLGAYFLGRSSVRGLILTTQHAPPATAAPLRALPAAPGETGAEAEERLDLNRATLEELMRLPGIGQVRAERILAYRESNGPFHTTDELMLVSGIGEKIYAGLRDLIYVEEQDENSDH